MWRGSTATLAQIFDADKLEEAFDLSSRVPEARHRRDPPDRSQAS
jgi:hypothetical protein